MIGFGRPGAHFDMIHNHMTWNEKFVKDHMPIDTFKFSIIRHPVSHLTSSWKYFFQSAHHVRARKIFREKNGVVTCLECPARKFENFESLKMRKFAKYIDNPEMFYSTLRNESYLQRYRYYLRSQLFSVVLLLRN